MKSINILIKKDPTFASELAHKINPYLATSSSTPSNDLTTALNNLTYGQKLKMFEKGDNFVTFCGRFLEHVQLTKMPRAQQLPFFLQSINDDILYERLKAVELTPKQSLDSQEFINEFKAAIFGDDAFYLKNKLLDCSQTPSESINEYTDRLRQKAAVAFPNNPTEADEMCLIAFVRGVNDPRIKVHLNKESFETFSLAIKSAKNAERAYRVCDSSGNLEKPITVFRNDVAFDYEQPRSSNFSYYHGHSTSSRERPRSSYSSSSHLHLDQLRSTYDPRESPNNKCCYICGDPNHFKRDCPNHFLR